MNRTHSFQNNQTSNKIKSYTVQKQIIHNKNTNSYSQPSCSRQVSAYSQQDQEETLASWRIDLVEEFDLLAPPPAEHQPNLKPDKIEINKMTFLGESLWMLYVRASTLFPPRTPQQQKNEHEFFQAPETLSLFLDHVQNYPNLTQQEISVIENSLKWQGHLNTTPKRLQNTDSYGIHVQACTVKCLLGYMYVTNPVRLQYMMEYMGMGNINVLRKSIPSKQLWDFRQKDQTKYKLPPPKHVL